LITTTRDAGRLRAVVASSKKGVVTMKPLSAVTMGLIAMAAYTGSCRADTITDWDAKATAVASFAALGQREVAIVDLAKLSGIDAPFDAVHLDNCL
jgi:hypothetical protein